ncbi:hypothetical protein P170DRAFT_280636 [Aspergillus steynii IBT 23096]|uniref:Cyclase n=1 Tax=Aspergillus steynii IBT 23096 TaxID=1392250 RepID=A0A2I2FU24_9EURO|nr:uncharacterized protein P170DRAFT_280636 [Aspergillus steynii IBT 23096]PLB44139.1 hypothetical protein P170DRAFT_280636 [Aspergillus steynii IBT 23096]
MTLPDFDNLPPVPDKPQGCAWGIFDKDGQRNKYGTLNLLAPEVVRAASGEIQRGVSVSLNWPIGSFKIPGFFRKALHHRVLTHKTDTGEVFAFDDEVEFNTQASSQWDSLCHVRLLPSGEVYNGWKPSIESLESGDPSLPTLDHWHERGCIVGRGVLIDFKSYAEAKGIEYSPFSSFQLSIADIEAVAAYQNTTFQTGDILIVRFGFTEALNHKTGDEQLASLTAHVSGLEGSVEMAKWLWNKHFAAIASDNMAVEVIPPVIDGEERPSQELVLHKWCLGMFGMPLGELWDLKALAEECRKAQRYTFFLTSAPMNHPGAVGSPPNVIAIL